VLIALFDSSPPDFGVQTALGFLPLHILTELGNYALVSINSNASTLRCKVAIVKTLPFGVASDCVLHYNLKLLMLGKPAL
jgi:hypothetical protein